MVSVSTYKAKSILSCFCCYEYKCVTMCKSPTGCYVNVWMLYMPCMSTTTLLCALLATIHNKVSVFVTRDLVMGCAPVALTS